jgi:hypothetical protein
MTQAAAGNAPANTQQTPSIGGLGVAFLRGRIRSMRRGKRGGRPGFLTVLTLPAPDTFSMPQAVEVWSVERLGDAEADVSVKVQIGGFPRSYESNREDDEGYRQKVTVQTADNTLTVIG